MADHHAAKDASRRRTYRHVLGRPLHPENAGSLQWGEAYRAFYQRAWQEVKRVLQPCGLFVLNIKDHIRHGERQLVTAWHSGYIQELGFSLQSDTHIDCPGMRFGANRGERIAYESVLAFLAPEAQADSTPRPNPAWR